MLKYDYTCYAENFRLKIVPLLWLIMIYGARHFFYLGAALLMPREVQTTPWFDMQAVNYLLLTDIPALLVLVSTGHRVPTAARIMRTIWQHGRFLLILTYATSCAAFAYLQWETLSDPDSRHFLTGVLVVLLDLAVIAYLLRSDLVSDIFNEFPEAPAPNAGGK